MVNIKGLDKAAVLAALYNRAKIQGLGFLQACDGDMTTEQAQKLLEGEQTPDYPITRRDQYFDYLYGRVMKVNLTSDEELDPRLYDRDNGEGAAAAAIDTIRD